MKNSLLIDNELLTQFGAKAMDITNYLQNWLPTKRTDRAIIYPEETWTNVRQNFEHILIFSSRVSTHIPSENALNQIYTRPETGSL